jgi:hypothetical protein
MGRKITLSQARQTKSPSESRQIQAQPSDMTNGSKFKFGGRSSAAPFSQDDPGPVRPHRQPVKRTRRYLSNLPPTQNDAQRRRLCCHVGGIRLGFPGVLPHNYVGLACGFLDQACACIAVCGGEECCVSLAGLLTNLFWSVCGGIT